MWADKSRRLPWKRDDPVCLLLLWSTSGAKATGEVSFRSQQSLSWREVKGPWRRAAYWLTLSATFLDNPGPPAHDRPAHCGISITYQSLIKKKSIDLLIGQSDGGNSSIGTPSCQMTLVWVKLSKTEQHRRQSQFPWCGRDIWVLGASSNITTV